MGGGPQFVRDGLWLDAELPPPTDFVAGPMQIPVMGAAKRHRIFVADFETEPSWLRESEVVGVGWLTPANQTGLRGNKLAVALVAPPTGLGVMA